MRTDVHSPTNLVTEDYEYEFAAYTGPGGLVDLMSTEQGRALWHGLIADLDPVTGRGVNQCHHCGAHIDYVAFLRHVPTGRTIVVGETCLENRFERASSDLHQLRKEAALNRKKHRIQEEAREFVALTEGSAALVLLRDANLDLFGLDEWPKGIIADIRAKLWRYGSISEKQVAFVQRLLDEVPAKLEAKARRIAEKATEVEVPAPTGREVIEGEVIKLAWKSSQFGESLKLTIKSRAENGETWLGWVTCPASLEADIERDDRVRLTATWTPAEEDGNFAFGKRPSKAVILREEKDEIK